MTAGWRWRSGAALAPVTAGSALLSFLSLRATSDGSAPSGWVLAAGTATLALLLWPLAARTTRVVTLTGVLAAGQLGAHALTVLLTGQSDGLVCCPSAEQVSPGPLGQLTAQAGWALVAVQLLVCLLLAALLRGARQLVDDTVVALAALLPRRLLVVVLPVVLPAPWRRVWAVEPADTGRVVPGAHRTRGPPAQLRPRPFPVGLRTS